MTTVDELAKVTDLETANAALITQLSRVVLVSFMIVGLMMSVSLLKWAVSNKLATIEVAGASTVTAEVRERQLGCLAKNIYHEAGNEPFEGKVAVAQVTMNRAGSGKFPEDVCGVIYQKNAFYERILCQFSWVCDRAVAMRPINKAAYNESYEVAKKVLLEGFRLPSLNNAMYYHADYINPGWNKVKIAQIGHHIFYK